MAIGDKDINSFKSGKFRSFPRAHKLLLLIFVVITGIGFVPFGFFSGFTHSYAYALIALLRELFPFNPSDIGTMEHQQFLVSITIPIIAGYSLFLALCIKYIFTHIGGTRHRIAIALSIALVMWIIMPFVVGGIVNTGYVE